jgi:hypothetical protein
VSCGRSLCVWPITRIGEPYHCVCVKRAWPASGCCAKEEEDKDYYLFLIISVEMSVFADHSLLIRAFSLSLSRNELKRAACEA